MTLVTARRNDNDTMIELSDEEFEARLKDPSLIATREECLSIINELTAEIGNISAQIDAFRIEMCARAGEMPQDRLSWCRRASYAMAMRRNECDRIEKRDRELRGVYQTTNEHDVKAARRAIQTAELEAAKAKNEAAKEKMQRRTSFERLFVRAAKEVLDHETYQLISGKANPGNVITLRPTLDTLTDVAEADLRGRQ